MDIKNILKKPRKIPYFLALTLFTTGASLILGFLSFGGMYALIPSLSLAMASFGLSVAYEGEIYLQNIKGALAKLFKNSYLENRLAKDFLLAHFPDTEASNYPLFFKDYAIQLQLLKGFGHKRLTSDSQKNKKKIEQTLSDMEKWFAQQIFKPKDKKASESSAYAIELQQWLAQTQQKEWQKRLTNRRRMFNVAKVFSVLSAAFMGLGTTYLVVEAFSVIPFFASISFGLWPFMIVPMAIIAGAAYGLLTYNSITDMINNNTLVKWYNKLKADLSQGITVRNVLMTLTAISLITLALALTICTAGTWWTIATNARPLFDWMAKMPSFIMGAINPVITGASAIFFNVQNTSESLELVDDALKSKENIFKKTYKNIVDGFKHLIKTENWLQILNPFRLVLKLTVTPLRILLFLGHLLSIAVTSDRMPGMSQILSALIAIISEGFEDAHYFIGHDHDDAHTHEPCADHHEHDDQHGHSHHDHHNHAHGIKHLLKERLDVDAGHNHDADIPTWILHKIASPLYALAALWDSSASRLNAKSKPHAHHDCSEHPHQDRRVLSLVDAWNKQRGNLVKHDVTVDANASRPSKAWQKEHIIAQIDKQERKHLEKCQVNSTIAQAKIEQLEILKDKVRKVPHADLAKTLIEEQKNPVYNQHRLFALNVKTCTQEFVEELPFRTNIAG